MIQINIPLKEVASNLNDFSWRILKLLEEYKQVNFKEIKEHTGLSQEKIYKEIARIEGALLINVQRDPNDQRNVLYSLTEYGVAINDLYKEE